MEKVVVTDGNGVRADPAHRFAPAAAIRRILIVGAGGFGREVLHWARDAWADDAAKIAGFLSADSSRRAPLPILGDPGSMTPEPHDAFILAIGIPDVRRRVAEDLESRGATFLTLVHPTAIVAPTAAIGRGSVLCPFSIASDSIRLGRFALLNYHSSLGHDAAAGDFAVLSPYSTLGGGAVIAEDVFLGLHAAVAPGKMVGARSKVTANSCVLADAPADSLVFGVPGRIAPRLDTEASR